MKYIYVCGPTVYAEIHIGNLRPIMTFDIFTRALKFLKEKFIFIHNITDIDDKIIAIAKKNHKTEKEISEEFTSFYLDTLRKFNINKPQHLPLVTKYMKEIIAFIEKLIVKEYAYIKEGNVYFSINKISNYGKIANRIKKNNVNFTRIDSKKRGVNFDDFVLWKKTNEGLNFDSPWSRGRPGWHTECVVFIEEILKGKQLDIHGGGIDLIFPHHENENAQFFALHQKNITKKWIHIGHLNVEKIKMSKSKGNVWSPQNFLKKYNADTLRLIFLNTSFTAPINLHNLFLEQAFQKQKQFYKIYLKIHFLIKNKNNFSSYNQKIIQKFLNLIIELKFTQAMKILNNLIKQFNQKLDEQNACNIFTIFKILGFQFTNKKPSIKDQNLFKKWEKLRNEKKFQEADLLREKLKEIGII